MDNKINIEILKEMFGYPHHTEEYYDALQAGFEALEKSEAILLPNLDIYGVNHFYFCPSCGGFIFKKFGNYCSECGQKVKYPKEEKKSETKFYKGTKLDGSDIYNLNNDGSYGYTTAFANWNNNIVNGGEGSSLFGSGKVYCDGMPWEKVRHHNQDNNDKPDGLPYNKIRHS